MRRTRVIPCLLLKGGGLVKTRKYENPVYIGDPINTVKIFNEKAVDELVLLDISASVTGSPIQFELIEQVVSEAFVPVCYGGGIRDVDSAAKMLGVGVEKVAINSAALDEPGLIDRCATRFGSQSVVVAIDVRKDIFGRYAVYSCSGKKRHKMDPVTWAREAVSRGAGEIFLSSIHCDGMMKGYDISLLQAVSSAVSVPVIASGGAGRISDFASAINTGHASAVAAGSMFVFHGPHHAVLISYPTETEMKGIVP